MCERIRNRLGNAKGDFAHGGGFVMTPRNAISRQKGRSEVTCRKYRPEDYQERMADVGCEYGNCYAIGALVRIGGRRFGIVARK